MDQKPLIPHGTIRPGGWRAALGGLMLIVTIFLTSCQSALVSYFAY